MTQSQQDPGFIKVSSGTIISGGMAYLFIRLLMSILHNLPPIAVNGSPLARSISIGVRYMLVGSIGLMAFMFSVVTIGLFAYSIQLAWQGLTGRGGSKKDETNSASGDSTPNSSTPNLAELVATERDEQQRDAQQVETQVVQEKSTEDTGIEVDSTKI